LAERSSSTPGGGSELQDALDDDSMIASKRRLLGGDTRRRDTSRRRHCDDPALPAHSGSSLHYTLLYDNMPGSGWCQNARGHEGTARKITHVSNMHDAANQCTNDPSCVAFAYDQSSTNLVLYTSAGCTYGCSHTAWLNDRTQITKAGWCCGHTHWSNAVCKVKRTATHSADKLAMHTDKLNMCCQCMQKLAGNSVVGRSYHDTFEAYAKQYPNGRKQAALSQCVRPVCVQNHNYIYQNGAGNWRQGSFNSAGLPVEIIRATRCSGHGGEWCRRDACAVPTVDPECIKCSCVICTPLQQAQLVVNSVRLCRCQNVRLGLQTYMATTLTIQHT